MHLDVLTLIFTGSFVSLIGAAVLFGAWLTMGRPASLLWWTGYALWFAIGAGLIGVGVTEHWLLATFAGGFANGASPALIWAGTRAFERRRVRPLPFFLAIGVWALENLVCLALHQPQAAMLSGFAIATTLLCAVEYELWRGRAEPLTARWGLIALVALHILVVVGGVYDTLSSSLVVGAAPPLNSWFGLINFEGLVFGICVPLAMVTMCRERITSDLEHASQVDALTGVANRRALFDGADRLFDRCQTSSAPLSVIAFDLDRFKAINDAHGHATGDAVLRTFVATTRSVLRQNDFFGRHGGEEFAVILPATTVEAAYVIAERARHAFAEASHEVGGPEVYATVSAGVAAMEPDDNFSDVLDKADRALYLAKRRGRNRVERAEDGAPADGGTVIRVA